MCRNIKNLRNPEHPPTEEEARNAALQFVRKVSGYRKPSQANQVAFDKAVADITDVVEELFQSLVIRSM